jgi:hypothetical protein
LCLSQTGDLSLEPKLQEQGLTILQEIQKLNERVTSTENALPMMEDRLMNELKNKMEQVNDVIIKEIRSSFSVASLTNLCKVLFYFLFYFFFSH